jgi:hypothetical protein
LRLVPIRTYSDIFGHFQQVRAFAGLLSSTF